MIVTLVNMNSASSNNNINSNNNHNMYQQPKTYPHPRIPAARLFSVLLCFPMLSSTWGNPEVGGGDTFWGS